MRCRFLTALALKDGASLDVGNFFKASLYS